MTEQLKVMTWNIKSGGFSSYDPELAVAEREEAILSTIREFRENAGNAVGLIDAYRWDEFYRGEEGIARHLGYDNARFVRLHDARLEQNNGGGIGIAFATDKTIEHSWALDLETRQGLGIILSLGRYGLQIANVYLDDLNEDVRLEQLRALTAGLEQDIPTVIMGDLNSLRPELNGSSLSVKIRDLALRGVCFAISRRNKYQELRHLQRREAIQFLLEQGYKDADNYKRPTFPTRFPVVGVDYIFHDDQISTETTEVVKNTTSSDHRAVVANITINAPADATSRGKPVD